MTRELFDLGGRVAVVTGASRGLGRYMARALAKAGADIVITSRTAGSLDDTAAEIESCGSSVCPLTLDVRDERSIEEMVERAYETYGKLDILVNNAGCNIRKPATEVGWEDWDMVVNTNLKGAFFVARTVARKMMLNRYGRIVNIGSVTSVFGMGGITPYCASRGGVKQMTMSLADDWGVHGITVNCLAPGWFRTSQTQVLYENREWVDYIVDRIPLKRVGEPDDLDGTVIFLASDASSYITGQTILVDGGISTGAMKASL
jgi:gluconate 5-dehydrogenase